MWAPDLHDTLVKIIINKNGHYSAYIRGMLINNGAVMVKDGYIFIKNDGTSNIHVTDFTIRGTHVAKEKKKDDKTDNVETNSTEGETSG